MQHPDPLKKEKTEECFCLFSWKIESTGSIGPISTIREANGDLAGGLACSQGKLPDM